MMPKTFHALFVRIGGRSPAKGLRRRACITSGKIATKFQPDGSRTDSPVRILLYRGGLVSSAFQTAPSIRCGMFTRRVLASLRDRHLGPPMMGSRGCGGPIYGDVLAVRLPAGIRTRNGLASSIVPAGTSLHRLAEFAFSPVVFYCAQLGVRYLSVTSVH
jgi:hypothetical protein